MRIPLIPNLSTKDGEANKNARMTNALSEKNPTGTVFCAVRPGLSILDRKVGNGRGIVEFNGTLLSVYGAELNVLTQDNPDVNYTAPIVVEEFLDVYPEGYSVYVLPQQISTGATQEGYSNIIMLCVAYDSNEFNYDEIYKWTEYGGVESINAVTPSVTGLGYDFRGGVAMSSDGSTVYYQSFVDGGGANNHQIRVSSLDGDSVIGPEDLSTYRSVLPLIATPSGSHVTFRQQLRSTLATQAVIWSDGDGYVETGFAGGGTQSIPEDLSDNGSIVVGRYRDSSNIWYPAKWDSVNGWVSLGTISGGLLNTNQASAVACSADGTVICGYCRNGSNANRAFIWTQATGAVDLDVSDTYTAITVIGMSADGSTIIGGKTNAGVTKAFKWTQSGGFVSLFLAGETYSTAYSVSDDGSVVVGASGFVAAYADKAWKWTEATGVVSLGTVSLTDLYGCHVSADGDAITGYGVSITTLPFVYGGYNYQGRLRSIATLEDQFFDFVQSTI